MARALGVLRQLPGGAGRLLHGEGEGPVAQGKKRNIKGVLYRQSYEVPQLLYSWHIVIGVLVLTRRVCLGRVAVAVRVSSTRNVHPREWATG